MITFFIIHLKIVRKKIKNAWLLIALVIVGHVALRKSDLCPIFYFSKAKLAS